MSEQQNNPLITVIIATYNSSATLSYAIKSVLNQTYSNFEVRVIGDACSDNSKGVVNAFKDPRLHWTNLDHNSGSQGEPNNEGLRQAKGTYVAYLGHDDLWFPWHLSELISCIQETNADLVHSLCPSIGPAGLARMSGPPDEGNTYAFYFFPPSSWLHRKKLVLECGYWEDHLKITIPVDFSFAKRIYSMGKRIEFHPQLSVLKFPSERWKIYSRQSNLPQKKYFNLMKEDADLLYQKVLIESATKLAKVQSRITSISGLAIRAIEHIINIYGRENWPLSSLLHWRFQIIRRRRRRQRGLHPYKS